MNLPTRVSYSRGRATAVLLALLLVAAMGSAASAAAPPGQACSARNNNTYEKLLECVSVEGAMTHMEAFQAIADANDGTRASGTSGYDASVAYVAGQLEAAGYVVTLQEFPFPFYMELSPAVLTRLAPPPVTDYAPGTDFITMTYSGAGDVTAVAFPVDLPPTGLGSGCEAEDFSGFPAGNIALMQRGGCTFAIKATNAEAAGAAGAIIFNQPAGAPAFAGTLAAPVVTIPVVGTSWDVGQEILGATVRLATDTASEERLTHNVFAETPGGRADNVVMIGAHLDSVVQGPGINDNGSGSAGLIEVAQKMRKVNVENKVRFAWWGAEEFGLIGSNYYVANLSQAERDDIALYLNYDMIASPNYVRFIYDGDGSAFGLAGPPGSQQIEELYEDFYGSRGLAWEPTEISFRSDYAAFFNAGIPFGGLFTGAEGIKTPAQAEIYGGTAGIQYDPCYHQACDTIDNLSLEVFDLNIDGVAFTALTYAYSTETVNGVPGRRVPGPESSVFGSRLSAPAGVGENTPGGGGGLHPERDPDHDDDHDHAVPE